MPDPRLREYLRPALVAIGSVVAVVVLVAAYASTLPESDSKSVAATLDAGSDAPALPEIGPAGTRVPANPPESRPGRGDGPGPSAHSPARQGDRSQAPERMTRAELWRELREASSREPSLALGCRVKDVSPNWHGSRLGPPAPSIRAKLIGDRIQVSYRFSSFPEHPTCRPYVLWVTARSFHDPSARGYTETVILHGRREGVMKMRLPFDGMEPWEVIVCASAINNRSGPRVTEVVG